MKHSNLLKSSVLGCALLASPVYANEADIYSVHFSEDGKHLITGGTSGLTLSNTQHHSGGIKIWDSNTGALVESLGQRADLDELFGVQYGRVGTRRWGISNFKDVVLTGSYPNGKAVLLPSSLGRMIDNDHMQMPSIIGGYMNFSGGHPARIELSQLTKTPGNCDPESGFHDYVGPVVPSNNGRFAAIVVNTCHTSTSQTAGIEYRSDLHVMDLSRFKVTKSFKHIDAGVYALGITDAGNRVAFVGRDQFAILDTNDNERHIVESYTDSEFTIPRQFSTLQFSKDGRKLVSLQNIYDIATNTETNLSWPDKDAKKPRRIASVKVAPDLSYFVMVIPKRSMFVFGDDGLPQSYGKADKVMLMNAKTGEQTELKVTKSMTRGKRCVTDIAPDSSRVAVGCKGGLLRVYNAHTGELVWDKQNPGEQDDHGLIQAGLDTFDELFAYMDYSASSLRN